MMIEPKNKTIPQTYSLNREAINKLDEISENYECSKSYIIQQLILDNYHNLMKYTIVKCNNCGTRYHIHRKQKMTKCEFCGKEIDNQLNR